MKRCHLFPLALIALGLLVFVGCGKISTDYGFSSGLKGEQSLNGFSALRKTFENAGFEVRDVRRLSDRQNRTDTIVWTPQVLTSIETDMTDWLEGWLAQGEHTLIYIVPDSGSEADYWLGAVHDAAPEQSLEYRRRGARAVNDRFRWRLNRSSVLSNGWFQIEPIAAALPIDSLHGTWSQTVTAQSKLNSGDVNSLGTIELSLEAYKVPQTPATSSTPATPASTTPSTTTTPPTTQPSTTAQPSDASQSSATPQANASPTPSNTSGSGTGNTGTASSGSSTSSPVIHSGPTGPADPYGFYMGTATPTSTKIKFDRLLSCTTDQSTPGTSKRESKCFVARVTSPAWRDSQILVVAAGSLLTNFGFTTPLSRSLADQLVDAAADPQDSELRAGFMTSDYGSVPISEVKPGAERASGMELLTTWPLSLVTMHAVFLGLVACLILMPIFGRPRQILSTSLSRFGAHLDAVAALMYRTRGEEYARRRISEYHRRVRGETTGPWVLPETPHSVVPTVATPNAIDTETNPSNELPRAKS